MSEIVPVNPFDAFGSTWRFGTAPEDGRIFVVIADVAKDLGHRDAANAARMLDAEEKGTRRVSTPGGAQNMLVAYEDGLWELVFLSRVEGAKAIKKRVKEILAALRRGETVGGGQDVATMSDRDKALLLARSLIDAEQRASDAINRAEIVTSALEAATPAIEHFERYVSPEDVMLVKDWAALFGLSDPKGRGLLLDKRIIYRKFITRRFSKRAGHWVDEFEYRAYADRATFAWFDLRPQETVDRHHNGQVRQTLYVRRMYALELGRKVGLAPPQNAGADLVRVERTDGAA